MTQIIVAPAGIAEKASSFEPQRASKPSVIARHCPLPAGWNAITARNPRFIVFGEMHGTQQAPAFFGDVACALAARGERILVAVEHASTENATFQKAWNLPSAEFPAALKRAGWADRNDGVGSEAMLALLVRLHDMRQRGQLIDVVAFSGAKDSAPPAALRPAGGAGAARCRPGGKYPYRSGGTPL